MLRRRRAPRIRQSAYLSLTGLHQLRMAHGSVAVRALFLSCQGIRTPPNSALRGAALFSATVK